GTPPLPQSVEVWRLRLANALLAAHRDGARGADALKAAALKQTLLKDIAALNISHHCWWRPMVHQAGSSMRVLDNISLGPENLSTVSKAFDAAWEIARHGYDANDPISTDAGRVRLANLVLTAYRRGRTDPEELKVAALRMLGIGE
ncbi:MAG: hypothetical protein ABW205_01645, partial [Burkholderiales bacterium]